MISPPEPPADPAEGVEPAPQVELLTPREVPLGGPRAMLVRRALPQRHRTTIGAWCFLDHFGPDDVRDTGGMLVPPHPHAGLQTVSWLFSGEIEHRDSAGNHIIVRPGELNLMTAGRGISHSEVSSSETRLLHGAQLWVALPDRFRDAEPGTIHHVPAPVYGKGWLARVFLGSVLGANSPVPTFTPLLGAELILAAGSVLVVPTDTAFEHGVLVDTGVVVVNGVEAKETELVHVSTGSRHLELVALDDPVRVLLLGGEPFGEPIVMWWNFLGRDHDEIVAMREEWQQQIRDDSAAVSGRRRAEVGEDGAPVGEPTVADAQLVQPGRFGVVEGDHLPPIPAPPMPNVRLKQRR